MTEQVKRWTEYAGQGNLFAGKAKSRIQILLDEIAGLECELEAWKRTKFTILAPGTKIAISKLQDELKQKRQLLRERRRLT